MSARLRATTGCGARLTEWQGMYASLFSGLWSRPSRRLGVPSAARLTDGLGSVFFRAPVPSGCTLIEVESSANASILMRTICSALQLFKHPSRAKKQLRRTDRRYGPGSLNIRITFGYSRHEAIWPPLKSHSWITASAVNASDSLQTNLSKLPRPNSATNRIIATGAVTIGT
jgi:hypothetical protein